jgi:hypothetical protein
MAGAYTHWMVIEEAITNLPDGGYATILGEKKNFVRIGAVGPDYPYLSEIEGKWFKIHSWADRMHYEKSLEWSSYLMMVTFMPFLSTSTKPS